MENVSPDLWLIAVDDTGCFPEAYQKMAGKVATIYLVDASVHTHLCSLTPSLWLRFVDFATAKWLKDEDYDKMREAYCDTDSDYFDVSVLQNKHKLNVTKYHIEDFPGYDDLEEYDEWINDIVEYYQGNDHSGEVLGWDWFEDTEAENEL